ncbi:MAG: cytochrome c peroxidase [Acidobacteriota bacterium]
MTTSRLLIAGFGCFALLCGLLAAAGCGPSAPRSSDLRKRILREFPRELPMPIPPHNPQTPEKVALGEALFFDPNLSACGKIACASCHDPARGLSDGERISDGCFGAEGRRNSNALYEVGYQGWLFWDGRVQSLEEQALHPVVDPVEMANRWDEVLHYLRTGEHRPTGRRFPEAAAWYRTAFDRVFAGELTTTTVARALAAYQRTLVSHDSPFDRWLAGENGALSEEQLRGAAVFFGRGRCSGCHPPPLFTDGEFHNVAVPPAGFERPDQFPDNERICGGTPEAVDPGRAGVQPLHSSCDDLGRFRTPSLRNVALSAPYMHNGVFYTLDDVVRHYWNVGRGTTRPVVGELDPEARGILLGDFGGAPGDFQDLVAFLHALTGTQATAPERGVAPPGSSPP